MKKTKIVLIIEQKWKTVLIIGQPQIYYKVTEEAIALNLQLYLNETDFLDIFCFRFYLGYGTKTALVILVDDPYSPGS